MQSRMMEPVLGILAVLAFSPVLVSQAAQQPAAARGQATPSTPDLTGVWMQRIPGNTFTREELPAQPWAVEKFKTNTTAPRETVDSSLTCFPRGLPRLFIIPSPMEIFQVPGRVIQLFEIDHLSRQIYTDGREHPQDLAPSWMGHSIGKWDGDTLVVDSIGFNNKTYLDLAGHPHSDALHLVEHIRRVDQNTLEEELTIDDPKAFTKPWGTKFIFKAMPGWSITEQVCEDNFLNAPKTEPAK